MSKEIQNSSLMDNNDCHQAVSVFTDVPICSVAEKLILNQEQALQCLQATANQVPIVDKKHSLKNMKVPKIAGNTCPICYKLLYSKTNVKRHILTEHENTMRSQCPNCDKTFASKTSLEYHS
jgi:RNase P subunit RPR2